MTDNFERAFDNAGGISFDGASFDEPDYGMLIVEDENDFLEHLRVQSAGTAYYTALARKTAREFDEFADKFKFRYNQMFAECSELLLKDGRKNAVKDVDAFIQLKYENELRKAKDRLAELRSRRDYVEAFLEGWKQKSFTLSSMADLIKAGLLTPRETIHEEDVQRTTARDILRKKA